MCCAPPEDQPTAPWGAEQRPFSQQLWLVAASCPAQQEECAGAGSTARYGQDQGTSSVGVQQHDVFELLLHHIVLHGARMQSTHAEDPHAESMLASFATP